MLAQNAYITNTGDNTVSVIATATNAVTATIPVGDPSGVAISPDGSKVYVTSTDDLTPRGKVLVIATATNTIIATIPVGGFPNGVAVTPDGTRLYVANTESNTVSVIATAIKAVTNTVTVGLNPTAVGLVPAPPGGPLQTPTISAWALFLLVMSVALLGAKMLALARNSQGSV